MIRIIVSIQEIGKAEYRIFNWQCCLKIVYIQRIRKQQVPRIVAIAGYKEWPVPLNTPAGIS